MEIKFDVYFKKNLGTLFKNNEVDLNGLHAHTNLQLALVDRLEINYKVDGVKYTDDVVITDATENLIQIPFKSDVMKAGQSEFELVAYMKNGDVKVSQTYTYNIEEGIGEGKQSGSGESSDGHTHNNLNVLNTITQTKVNEWNNKADRSEIPTKTSQLTNDSDYATNASVDEKIASASTGGTVDLSSYAKKTDIPTKTSQLTNDSGFITEVPSEYITENELNTKGFATETYVQNKIAEASLSGGEVDLSGLGADLSLNGQTLKLKNSNGVEIGTGVILPTATGTGSGMTDDEINTVLINVFGENYLPQVYGNITTSVNELSINEGESKTFTVSLSQVPTRPQTITISSNNSDVTVNPSSINISDTNPHTITVAASEDDDYADDTALLTLSNPYVLSANVTVNVIDNDEFVPVPCQSISLSHSVLSLEQGQSQQITATPTPSNTTDEIIWNTSNENCTVNNGLVRAINVGECIITATCGGHSATCNVTIAEASTSNILPKFNTWTATNDVTIDGDYSVSIESTSWNKGISTAFDVAPGNYICSYDSNGCNISIKDASTNSGIKTLTPNSDISNPAIKKLIISDSTTRISINIVNSNVNQKYSLINFSIVPE